MRAVVCESVGAVEMRDVPDPQAGPGEVVVRVEVALTCGTDLKLVRRGHPKVAFPCVLGHEFGGVVESVGEGAPFHEGERVTSAVSGPCEDCEQCRAGRQNLCATAFDHPVWGAFAERLRVPARVVRRGLRRIPEALPFESAALLDPLASVVRGVGRLGRRPGSAAMIVGTGPIALMFAALLPESGITRLLVAGRRPSRFDPFRELGAQAVLFGDLPLSSAIFEAGPRPDVVIDTTGATELVPELVASVASAGTLLLFAGFPKDGSLLVPSGPVHYDEVTVMGSFHYTPAEADEALALLTAGRIPIRRLVTGRRPLERFAAALADLERGEGMKTALCPSLREGVA